MFDVLSKNQRYNERSPVPGLEPVDRENVDHYAMIDDNDSGTSRPVAIMIVGKAEINVSGSFRISHQCRGDNLYGLKSEIINSPQATNNSLKRNLCC